MRNPTKTIFWALAAAVFTAGCADGPMAPELPDMELTAAYGKPDNGGKWDGDSTLDPSTPPVVVQWLVPLLNDITVTKVCDQTGCDIDIPEVEMRMVIPRWALDEPTEISLTALAGTQVNFQFGPHGTQFNRPVKVKVAQERTLTSSSSKFTALYWVDDPSNVVEVIPATLKWGKIEFETDHFSGYAIAM